MHAGSHILRIPVGPIEKIVPFHKCQDDVFSAVHPNKADDQCCKQESMAASARELTLRVAQDLTFGVEGGGPREGLD